ncbi:hypothetical protein F511_01302 [Dorcoceras hygrometricum]|uniref:BHLH domain-containing protein n=1 Tax=Dorcoceras hygrometricum TaxID=472368 RepID=A0A2Z7D4C8_9LAMI|nr:hypothetical protein F511_01302 [Dorcoceras hygrometricum]
MEYSSEMCLMEELLLVKDMEYYNYPNDVEDFDSLDTFLATNKNNIISSSINAHCSFEDYFPIDTLQTFNYDEQQYSNIYLNNSTTGGLLDGFQRPSVVADEPLPVSNESKNETKKVNGQPSKNLMAERRRRKRLNDRLSMLRSVVPKISKMDRTSILGDTIDYMKELREKINNLQEEMEIEGGGVMRVFKDANKPKEILAPKSEVLVIGGNKYDGFGSQWLII